MEDIILSDKKYVEQKLSLKSFYLNIPNIDRACSTVIENSTAIFLPHKRLDKTKAQERFYKDNQTLEVSSNLFDKVEIKGRLLCQTHKDILEVLLTSPKIYNKETKAFTVKTTAYKILQRLGKATTNKKWVSQKLDEIAECRVKIKFNSSGEDYTFNFGFIDAILGKNDKEYAIKFEASYSHFMAKNEMLDYSKYVDDILAIDSAFVRSVVRYMLTNKGNNSQIRINNLIEILNLRELISEEQLKDDLTDLRREETQEMLKEKFGITLTNEEKTITYNATEPRYHIQPVLDLK